MRFSRTIRSVSIPATLLLFALTFAADPIPPTSPAPALSIKFSCVGFNGDGSTPPTLPALLLVRPTGADDTTLLQSAIDRLASLPPRPDGFRGTLQLAPGTFHISGQLLITHSGIILRGDERQPTTLLATGHSRRTLIEVGEPQPSPTASPQHVTDEIIRAGSQTLTLDSTQTLTLGDPVTITRPCTAEWIAALGMKNFPGTFAPIRLDWTPGSRILRWDRTITAIDPTHHQVTLDAPITTAIESRFGGATLAKVTSPPLTLIGIENLTLDSAFDSANPRDEEHAWIAVALHTVQDAWVRNITARHFAGSAVRVGPDARRITVDNCRSESPISEPAGYRRQSFLVEGQQVLVEHCTADSGMNDFAVGLCAAGPNVFFDCSATNALGSSGSFESWASGVLYENVRIAGAGISLNKDMARAQGAGWTAANAIVSNCDATAFNVQGPPDAPNLLILSGPPLYTPKSPAPPITEDKFTPTEFILQSSATPLAITPPMPSLQIIHGHFVIGDHTLWGGAVNDAWWKGEANPNVGLNNGLSITRFVPGRDGPGMIENLPALAARMQAEDTPFYQSGPGLWYDRRRDEHSVNDREDPNVWAPFNELPWARSGRFPPPSGVVGTNPLAWDGLSRYDLTRYNTWYFDRTRAFANLCQQHGILLYHSLYNTHNLLEWGAHWIDSPWRPANNINQTNLPEPPPLEPGDPTTQPNIRIHVANQFYNVDDPSRRALHHAYIFHVLDQLGPCPNVVFGVAYQFPGPLAFQQFFLDTVAEWEQQNGRTVHIELATSKDITDAILADPVRSKQISVVDLRYWQYRPDGSLWAPPGGTNHAFREADDKGFGSPTDFPPATTPQQLYRQVREYHDRFPEKALVAWNAGVGPAPILFAGGAECLNRNPTAGHGQRSSDLLPFDALIQKNVGSTLMSLLPRDGLLANPATTWCLSDDPAHTLLIYSLDGPTLSFTQPLPQTYSAQWLNPRTGAAVALPHPLIPANQFTVSKPTAEPWILLLRSTP